MLLDENTPRTSHDQVQGVACTSSCDLFVQGQVREPGGRELPHSARLHDARAVAGRHLHAVPAEPGGAAAPGSRRIPAPEL